MNKSEALELAIVSVIDNAGLDANEMIDVLEALFDELRTAKLIERREADNAAAS